MLGSGVKVGSRLAPVSGAGAMGEPFFARLDLSLSCLRRVCFTATHRESAGHKVDRPVTSMSLNELSRVLDR